MREGKAEETVPLLMRRIEKMNCLRLLIANVSARRIKQVSNFVVGPELQKNHKERKDELRRLKNAIVEARQIARKERPDKSDVADQHKNQNHSCLGDEPTSRGIPFSCHSFRRMLIQLD